MWQPVRVSPAATCRCCSSITHRHLSSVLLHHPPPLVVSTLPLHTATCRQCSSITHHHLSLLFLHHTPPLVVSAPPSLTCDGIVVERLLTTISQPLARYSDVSTVGVSLEWFAGAMGKRSCESAVASASHGSFLVREGSTGERFVLCVNDRGKSSQARKAFM
jgi:hypothetical protein